MNRPVLYFLVGYPGAGKSTFGRQFSKFIDAQYLCADSIGFELFRFPTFSAQERQLVIQTMEDRAYEAAMGGQSSVFDMASGQLSQRQYFRSFAQSINVPAVGIWVKTSADLSRQRAVKIRQLPGEPPRRLTHAVFDSVINNFELPESDEDIRVISGEKDFPNQLSQIRSQLRPEEKVQI